MRRIISEALDVPPPPVVKEVVARLTGDPSRSAAIGIGVPLVFPPGSEIVVRHGPLLANQICGGPTVSAGLATIAFELEAVATRAKPAAIEIAREPRILIPSDIVA
ncbi:MAG: hypothetical protein ABIO86_21260 [Sphingomonas sp.]